MTFSEKLDFLMTITKTSNSALAHHANLDPSHISRLRRGGRTPSKHENYLKAMAAYFSKHGNEDYQRSAISDLLKSGPLLPNDHRATAKLIYQWLTHDKTEDSPSVLTFLEELSHFQQKKAPAPAASATSCNYERSSIETRITYGTEGKRKAVIDFLTEVVRQEKQMTLLLYSDEDIGWMLEDRQFTAQWAALLSQVILRGHRVIIIHTVNRDLDEMLAAIGEWLPIYMTGAIDPYYYPKKRDGLFKRTLFIAPETAAVVSTSIGTAAQGMANFLIYDPEAVAALAKEYNNHLVLCRPLMRIFTPKNKQDYSKMLTEFEKEPADAIVRTDGLSILTMPSTVAEMMCSRITSDESKEILAYHQQRTQNFLNNLSQNRVTEILRLPALKDIQNGRIKVGFTDMFHGSEVTYTVEEFRLHLENMLLLLKTVKNYKVCISTDSSDCGYRLYVKEDLGVMVAKAQLSSVIFAINESNMTGAFWDFGSNIISKAGNSKTSTQKVIARIEGMIEKLKP